jgi:hypothetical protein
MREELKNTECPGRESITFDQEICVIIIIIVIIIVISSTLLSMGLKTRGCD